MAAGVLALILTPELFDTTCKLLLPNVSPHEANNSLEEFEEQVQMEYL